MNFGVIFKHSHFPRATLEFVANSVMQFAVRPPNGFAYKHRMSNDISDHAMRERIRSPRTLDEDIYKYNYENQQTFGVTP
jgi:hypothetical protein